jgi:cell division protein YceG involved in septum cleavage
MQINKDMFCKRFTLFITLVFLCVFFFFFEYSAKAKLDSAHILIGDYLNVSLEVTAPKGKPVFITQLDDKALKEAEAPFDWIANSKFDTVFNNDFYTLKQTITITAFDSGSYVFPPIPIFDMDTNMVAQTNSLFFEVSTIAVDTTAAIKDIKSISKIPFSFHELWMYVKEYALFVLVGWLVIGLIIYAVWRYLKKKRAQKPLPVVKPKPKIKPHITALKELEKLRHKKLCEQGRTKEYYSELIDIVRIYMDDQWDIGAMEMVTSEIMEALKDTAIHEEVRKKLHQALTIADLVKFAKYNPFPTDHDMAFKDCKEFVERTVEVVSD